MPPLNLPPAGAGALEPLVSAFRAEQLGRPYAMFDFWPVGAAAAAGLLFISK